MLEINRHDRVKHFAGYIGQQADQGEYLNSTGNNFDWLIQFVNVAYDF